MIAEEDFRALASSVDRRSTWGADDRLGALHFLTAAATAAAVEEVRTGQVVACASRSRGAHARSSSTTESHHAWTAVNETLELDQHGANALTHIDSLGHFYYDGRTHAGAQARLDDRLGPGHLDVVPAAAGIVGRGLLIDLPATAGLPYLTLGRDVGLAEILVRLDATGTRPRAGDILFVRTGAPQAPIGRDGLPAVGGLDLDCVPWIFEQEFAVIVSDAGLDSPRPIVERVATPWHILAITRMGIPLVDFADLESLAAACAASGRTTFLACIAVLPLPGSTASPVNPLAIL